MAVQNCIGDAFRGATWVSLHNGGGVGWGEVINGGFGLVLDGSDESRKRAESMLSWDVSNGVARRLLDLIAIRFLKVVIDNMFLNRSWAGNQNAILAIKRAMETDSRLKVTLPNVVDDKLLAFP